MDIVVERAEAGDAGALAEAYNQSFYSDYVKYGECPGYGKTAEDMLRGMQRHDLYKILADGVIVGAISVAARGPGRYYLGALCVVPGYAGRGIGQRAMALLDERYPQAEHWALETPADKEQNHHFYKKLGYRITREYMDGGVPICYFEREVPRP